MNYKVIDLFAGAGGFGLGFHLANYDVKLSVENDTWAVKTLRANRFSSQRISHADIRRYRTIKDIKSICSFKPDLIIGGPPCQGFSVAASLNRNINDHRNNLFKFFALWVKNLNPKIFIMENVKGILTWRNKGGKKIIDIILKTFESLGYKVEIWILNSAEYGVPQNRERIFIVGNKYDTTIGIPPKTHYLNGNVITNNNLKKAVTVGDALSDLPIIYAGEGEEKQKYQNQPSNEFQKLLRVESSNVLNHVAMKHTQRLINRFKEIQNGNLLSDMNNDYKVKKRGGNGVLSEIEYHSNYRHLKADKVSFTIPAHFYSSFIHPDIPRNITAREAARLQSFPDWYIFRGKRTVISSKLLKKQGKHEENYLSQYNQIGNAVPPLLAEAIARHIKFFLDCKLNILLKKQ